MSKNESKRKMRHIWRNIWIVVLLLLIAIMLTLMLLTPVLGKLVKGDRNIIPLTYDGDREIFNKGVASYIRVDAEPAMITYDDKVQWTVNTDIDLFKTTYVGDGGEITVESSKGDKIIAPGTSDEYEFTLKNTGNLSLDYKMLIDSEFALFSRDLPMRVRLRCGDRWIIGGKDSWVDTDSLSEVAESGTLAVNQYVTYTFEWQWPYEIGADDAGILNDLNDTAIAQAAADQDVTFNLSITTESVATPGAVPVSSDGIELVEPLVLWNVLSRIVFPLLFILGILLILLILFRRPLYVTGFIPAAEGTEFKINKKKTDILSNERFVFKKVYVGKRRFILGEKECRVKLKYKSKLEGIAFEFDEDKDLLMIYVGRKVRAIELYMLLGESEIIINQENWAAIDKKRNVITPDGVTEPENKENTTPGGLHINKRGYFEIIMPDPTEK